MTALALAAAHCALSFLSAPDSGHIEYVAALYEDTTGVHCTEPKTAGRFEDVDGVRITYPKGAELLALIHNHAYSEHLSREEQPLDTFSDGDKDFAKRLGLPLYLLDMKTGNLLVFEPKARHVY